MTWMKAPKCTPLFSICFPTGAFLTPLCAYEKKLFMLPPSHDVLSFCLDSIMTDVGFAPSL